MYTYVYIYIYIYVGIKTLHLNYVVHRDVKPANILINSKETTYKQQQTQ